MMSITIINAKDIQVKEKLPKLLVAIVGESGCGKSTVIEELNKYTGFHKIDSYTTRPKRYEDEKGHIFVDSNDYAFIYRGSCDDVHCILDVPSKTTVKHIAHTLFNGYHYWATESQIVENGCTLYAIDPYGLQLLQENYNGNLLVIYLKSSEETRVARMLMRGDDTAKVNSRIIHDREAFKFIKCDYAIDVNYTKIEELIPIIKEICAKELAELC